MATTFAYKVRDKAGKMVSGTLEADSQALVVSKLKQMGFAPLLVEEQKTNLGKKEMHLPWGNRVKDTTVSMSASPAGAWPKTLSPPRICASFSAHR